MTRTAFIAIIGRPNVGKSTLMNAMVGDKVAIVSSKPQTTRNRITGILTRGDDQFVFIDTPGIHTPRTKLGSFMIKSAKNAVGESDAVIMIAEAGRSVGEIERGIIENIKASELPAILVLNKTDLSNAADIAKSITEYAALHDFDAVIPTSAAKGRGVDEVLGECARFMRESVWFFTDDMITDQPERRIAAEIIREKLLRSYNEEIPHGTAVIIEEFKEEPGLVSIRAEIYCEKKSHKGIIVGKNGEALKAVGTKAREDLERFLGTKVYLNLWVKVKEKWRDSDFILNDFGYGKESE